MVDKKLLEEWLRALPEGDDVYPAQGSQGSKWHGVELVSRETGVRFEIAGKSVAATIQEIGTHPAKVAA